MQERVAAGADLSAATHRFIDSGKELPSSFPIADASERVRHVEQRDDIAILAEQLFGDAELASGIFDVAARRLHYRDRNIRRWRRWRHQGGFAELVDRCPVIFAV